MADPKYLMKTEDGYIYPWTKGLSMEPGFIPVDQDRNPIGGAAGLRAPGMQETKITDPYSIMKKEILVTMLKSMAFKVEEYFGNKGEAIPDFDKEHIAKLRKYAKEILETHTAPVSEPEPEG